jgi:hypothetical protein
VVERTCRPVSSAYVDTCYGATTTTVPSLPRSYFDDVGFPCLDRLFAGGVSRLGGRLKSGQ